MRPPKSLNTIWVQRASGLVLGEWCTQRGHHIPCLISFSTHLFIWLSICILGYIFYNKPIRLTVSLSSLSHSIKLLNPRRGVLGTLMYSQSEMQVTTWDLWVVSAVGAISWDWALSLWDLTLTPGKYGQNWIVGHPARVTENCLMCGKPTYLVSKVKCGHSVRVKEKHTQGVFFSFYIRDSLLLFKV